MAWIRFRSKPCADVLMLPALAQRALTLMGRDDAPAGLLDAADLPQLLDRLQQAIAMDEQGAQEAEPDGGRTLPDDDLDERPTEPRLRQRLWPLMDMLRRSHAAGEPVMWSR